jgi:prevent-host-death family protein
MWNLQDAKNRFSALVEAALSGQPQEVTRRGKPAVVVLSAAEYHRLVTQARAARDSFAEHLLRFPGTEPASETDRLAARPRDVAF